MTDWLSPNPFRSMTQVKEAQRRAGFHFFERDTMSFFRSRVESPLIGGRLFVTSEQFVDSRGNKADRRYTIREVQEDASIDTVGKFQEYDTKRQAIAAAKKMVGQ